MSRIISTYLVAGLALLATAPALANPDSTGDTTAAQESVAKTAPALDDQNATAKPADVAKISGAKPVAAAMTDTEKEANARQLVADDYDPDASVLICRKEKSTGSRLPKKRCRTVQQMRREALQRKDALSHNTSRLPRKQPSFKFPDN